MEKMSPNEPKTKMKKSENAAETEEIKPTGKNRARAEIFDWVQTFCQALFAVVFIFTFLFRFVTVDGHSMDRTLADKDRLIISNIGYTPERGDIVVIHDPEAAVDGFQLFRGPIIKRVIATAGETVMVDYDNWTIQIIDADGNVHVLEDPYVNFPAYDAGDNIGIPRDTKNGTYIFDVYHATSSQPNGIRMGLMRAYVEAENREKYPIRQPDKNRYPKAIGNLVSHTVAEGHVFVCGDNRANSLDSRFVGDIDTRKILGKVLWRVFPFTSFGTVGHVKYAA